MAPTGSSTFAVFSKKRTLNTTSTPAANPIIMELKAETFAQGEVIATKPANAPLKVMVASGFLNIIHAVNMAAIEPAAAAKLVLTAIEAVSAFAAVVLPGLNPNQPNHNINVPNAASVKLCPGIALGFPSAVYLPILGPRTTAPAKATHPPIECTTVDLQNL